MDEEVGSQVVQHAPDPSAITGGWGAVLWAYPVFSLVLMAINLYFIIHAVRSGRPFYWIWIIFAMPVLGAAAYYFVEMRPRGPKINWNELKWRWSSPAARIATLAQIADSSPTIKNRSRLAREYESQGLWPEAVTQYRECLTGVFRDDPRLRIQLASSLLESKNTADAHAIASAIPEQRDPILEEDRKLILCRTLSGVGSHSQAIEGLCEIVGRTSSLAPRFYLAQAKHNAGQKSEATKEIEDLIRIYRNGNALLRRTEEPWYRKARWLQKQF